MNCLLSILILLSSLASSAYSKSLRGEQEVALNPQQQQRDRDLSSTLYYYHESDEAVLGAANPDAALGNPLKGLMGSPKWSYYPLSYAIPSSLEYYYMALDEILLEDPAVVGIDAAYNWTALEVLLNESSSRSAHAVIRFFIHYPGRTLRLPLYLIEQGVEIREYSSGGSVGYSPYYGDQILLNALQDFITQFGAKYDGDTRVAYIQMGLLGAWGEWHTFFDNTLLPISTKDLVLQWFHDVFKITKVQTRYGSPQALALGGLGLHDDSFGYSTLDGEYNGGKVVDWYFWPKIVSSGGQDFWRSGVMGGETRPELQKIIFSEDYPTNTVNHQSFLACTEITHATYMLHHGAFNIEKEYNGTMLANAHAAHARMGYNFQVTGVAAFYTTTDSVTLDVTLKQIGVAPFYYPLSIQASCPDLATPVSKGSVETTLIAPGDSQTFQLSGLPATASCLEQVTLSLESDYTYDSNPIKFAQGTDGTVVVNIPVPLSAIEDRSDAHEIVSCSLLDIENEPDLASTTIVNGDTYDLAIVGHPLSLSCATEGPIDKMTFQWHRTEDHSDTPQIYTTKSAPFAMFLEDNGVDYAAFQHLHTPGKKMISVMAYEGSRLVDNTVLEFYISDSRTEVPVRLESNAVVIPEGCDNLIANSDMEQGYSGYWDAGSGKLSTTGRFGSRSSEKAIRFTQGFFSRDALKYDSSKVDTRCLVPGSVWTVTAELRLLSKFTGLPSSCSKETCPMVNIEIHDSSGKLVHSVESRDYADRWSLFKFNHLETDLTLPSSWDGTIGSINIEFTDLATRKDLVIDNFSIVPKSS